mgnify:CR=1 FL=1
MTKLKNNSFSLEKILFSTPEQKLLRFLLSESTSSFSIRELSSKLKRVRGLGGAEGLKSTLEEFNRLEIVFFLDNGRNVRLNHDHYLICQLKVISSVCNLEGIREVVQPFSAKGILFGSQSTGLSRSDSDYDLFIVSDQKKEVEEAVRGYPFEKKIELIIWTQEEFHNIRDKDEELYHKLEKGFILWGTSW